MKHVHRWEDEAGDVPRFSNRPNWVRPDAVAMYAAAGDGFLHLAVELREGLIAELAAQSDEKGMKEGAQLAEFFLDADNNPETGEHDFFVKERVGFEYQVSVLFGFLLHKRNSGASYRIHGSVAMSVEDITDIVPVAACNVYRLDDGNYHESLAFTWKGSKTWSEDPLDELATISGDIVEVRIPYTFLGLKEGDAVRIAAKEPPQGFGEEAYLGEAELRLR